MFKRRNFLLLFVAGLAIGVVFGLGKAKASSPVGETSGGEQPASVYFDETWQATEAIVSTAGGYKIMDPSTQDDTDIAAQWGEDGGGRFAVTLFPKMVVTEWTVHGHIHFE